MEAAQAGAGSHVGGTQEACVLGKRKREYACTHDGCEYVTTDCSNFNRHRKRVHEGEARHACTAPHACTWGECTAAFVESWRLARHMQQTHLRVARNTHACTWDGCRVTRPTQDALAYHVRRAHTGFACTWDGCTAVFTERWGLARHMQQMHLEKPHACTWNGCTVACSTAELLRYHVRSVHTGDKPHVCTWDGCGAAFMTRQLLLSHVRYKHTREKPFVCTWPGCDAAFCGGSELSVHMRYKHTGERPYKCTAGCGAAFVTRGHLQVHMRGHTGDTPYVCTECGYRGTQLHELKSHMRRWHTAEGLQRQKRSENRLAKALTVAGVAYAREHRVDTTCVRVRGCRYIDFLLTHHAANGSGRGVVIAVENDERQHEDEDADCHCKRMAEVVEALTLGGNTLPVAFLRFNPHGFAKDGVPCKVPYADRLQQLLAAIDVLKAHVDAGGADELPPLSIRYLFYDTDAGGRPCLLQDPLYAQDLVPCVA